MTDRTCSIGDCDRKHCAKGYCKKHYYDLAYVYMDHECRVPGCVKRTTQRTSDRLCPMHYRRQRVNGTLEALRFAPTADMTAADVLHFRSEPHGDCIHWTGGLNADMYGVAVQTPDGPMQPHRYSWTLANGVIPAGMTVDHLCHTHDATCAGGNACLHRRCINPDHMEIVTQSENGRRQWQQRRAKAKARAAA